MPTADTIQRFIFDQAPISGRIVHLDATWRAVLERRKYPGPVRNLLGEFMAAAALLTSTLKFEGRMIIQAQGHGPIKLLVVECSSERTLRGLAQWEGDIVDGSLPQLLGNGRLVITIEPRKGKERYQGIVELSGDSVAEALECYFTRSEQLATRLWLTANGTQAAGFLLQQLPGGHVEDESWNRAAHLAATLTTTEMLDLPAPELLHRLYHEDDIRLFEGAPMSFRCSCSRDRVEGVLRMLGPDEVRSILSERGAVDVDCEFCGGHYRFDAVDTAQLFTATPAVSASLVRH
jgi:molecular chaperone Hsp33